VTSTTFAIAHIESVSKIINCTNYYFIFFNKLFIETIAAYIAFPDITERKRAEKALLEKELLLRRITDNMMDVIILADYSGTIRYASPSFRTILRHRNGMILHTEFDIVPLKTGTKAGHYQVLIRDITDRKLAEMALTKTLAEKETLLRELHHRVKNSFAIITGIIGLEVNRLNGPAIQDVLKDLRNRVASLSNLYDILNRGHDLKDIRLDHYLDQMSRSLIESYDSEKGRIALDVRLDEIRIDVNRAIPIGLMVNELLTNALKHAFPENRRGTIGIALKHEGDAIGIEVSDNGAGLPPDFSINKPKGLGYELVRLLATQLNGTIMIDSAGKTVFSISIPL
jgi:two-component sensor histidine kinase